MGPICRQRVAASSACNRGTPMCTRILPTSPPPVKASSACDRHAIIAQAGDPPHTSSNPPPATSSHLLLHFFCTSAGYRACHCAAVHPPTAAAHADDAHAAGHGAALHASGTAAVRPAVRSAVPAAAARGHGAALCPGPACHGAGLYPSGKVVVVRGQPVMASVGPLLKHWSGRLRTSQRRLCSSFRV